MTVSTCEVEQQAHQQQALATEPLSALEANIKEKQDKSYYYAHRKKATGEAPAPPPVHTVLERTQLDPEQLVHIVSIFTYQFLDEGNGVIKVDIPLEEVGARCTDDDIKSVFEDKSFDVSIHNYKPRQVYRLAVPELYGFIVPEECRVKRMSNKVVVTLKKKVSDGSKPAKWYKLNKD